MDIPLSLHPALQKLQSFEQPLVWQFLAYINGLNENK
jgi:hypothetical protein